MIILITINIVT